MVVFRVGNNGIVVILIDRWLTVDMLAFGEFLLSVFAQLDFLADYIDAVTFEVLVEVVLEDDDLIRVNIFAVLLILIV